MKIEVEECDWWWFRELAAVLAAFADHPEHTIARVGGGKIDVGEDLGEDLEHFLDFCILAKYPDAAGLAVVQAGREIEAILARKSLGGEGYEEAFWSNESFRDHPEWKAIRGRARAFLLR